MLRKILTVFCAIAFLVLPEIILGAENPQSVVEPATLSLDQCLDFAFKNSQQIKATAKSVEIAQAAVKEVEGGFWPKLDYSIFANKSEEKIYPYPWFVFPYASTDYSGAVISLTQPLYLGGQLTDGLHLAKAQLNMALENERQTKQQLTFQVKQAFYQVWLAQQSLKVAQSSLDNLEHHVAQVEGFYQEGTVSKFELLRAKVQRDSLKPQVIAAQNGLKLAKLSMAVLIGFPKDRPYSVEYDSGKLQIPEQSNISADQNLESAYRNRPEMHQIKQAKEIRQYQIKLAEAGYKPNVALVGQYQGASQDYVSNHWTEGVNKLWTLTLSISGNFFNGFATPAKVTEAKKALELTTIQESGLRDQIRLEVDESLQNIQESLEVIRANESNIDMAKESLELTQARFEENMATTMDIMDSQLALDQALNGYYRGIAFYLTAEAKLDLTVGKDRISK
jgi:outer membrane protein